MSISFNFPSLELCGNCNSTLSENNPKVTALRLEGDLIDELLVYEAIFYIYGIRHEVVQEVSKKCSKLNQDCARNEAQVSFCGPCASLLTENFKTHKLFESRIDPSSFVGQVKKFCEKEWTSEVMTQNGNILSRSDPDTLLPEHETECRENGEDDFLFEDFNFEDERHAGMSKSEEEIEEKYEVVNESGQEFQGNELPLRRSTRMKNVVVKLEKLSAEDLKAQFGIETKNYNKSSRQNRFPTRKRERNAINTFQGKDPTDVSRKSLGKPYQHKNICFKCDICGRDFKSRLGLRYHTKTGHGTEEEKGNMKSACEICGKVMGTQSLKRHIDKHSASRDTKKSAKYRCKICEKTFKDRGYYLYKHLPRHYKDILFKCDICGRDFKSRFGLRHHTKTEHGTEEEKGNMKSTCEICGIVVSALCLKGHIDRKHSATRETYKCEPCDKTFICKVSHSEHMLTHSKDFEPVLCTMCGKSFRSKKSLLAHEEKHTKEKKYSCDVCQLKFFHMNQVLRHKACVHTTERKYICEEKKCGKSFKFPQHLKNHLKLHKEVAQKGEYSVKCEECGAFLKHSEALYKHTARYHRPDLKKKVHKCAYCEKVLSSGAVLRIHVNLHEKDPGYQPRKKQTWKDNIHGHLRNAGPIDPT